MLSRIMIAVGGLLFGVAIIAGVELLLAALGVGDDAPLRDPFAGFSSVVPMFELVTPEDGAPIYRISPSRVGHVHLPGAQPQREFLSEKPDNELRIFVIGGSSAEGVPYSTAYSFSTWLERRLDAALPMLQVKVVNAALSGYASRRIVFIVREIAEYQPDLIVVYMGHNEWAESMYYEHLLKLDPRIFRVLEWAYGTRIYALASRVLDLEAFQSAPQLDQDPKSNMSQMFGVLRGRASGRGYPSPRELAYRDLLYEHNLRDMARTMKQVGADLVFLTLSQNFSDWPPPASTHREDLSDRELLIWERNVKEGKRLAAKGSCVEALDSYHRALEIDDEFADLHFRIASCQRNLGRLSDAFLHYRRASDLDRVPQGASTRFNDIIQRIARSEGAVLVDVDAMLTEESGEALVGDDLFTDFAHPNLRAHQLIAASVSEAMRAEGIPIAADRWRAGYTDPPLEDLYREEPRLKIVELQSRVFVCLVAPRESCGEEAKRLLGMDPDNRIAKQVLKSLFRKSKG